MKESYVRMSPVARNALEILMAMCAGGNLKGGAAMYQEIVHAAFQMAYEFDRQAKSNGEIEYAELKKEEV